MSTKQKQVLSIKEKQIIISHWDKKEKGTNLAQEFGISKQQISDIRKNRDKILKRSQTETSNGKRQRTYLTVWIEGVHEMQQRNEHSTTNCMTLLFFSRVK